MIWLLTTAALAQSQGSFLSPGPLAQAHADLDTVLGCTSCHAPLMGVTAARCLACHEHVQDQITKSAGFHADKAEGCPSCHSDHHGLDFDMLALDKDAFDHDATGFTLTGEHDKLDCKDCHTDEDTFIGLSQTCRECHDDVHGAVESTHTLLTDCKACHGTVNWEVESIATKVFDHTQSSQVDYPLEGKHIDVDCAECHVDAVFLPTKHERCADCHVDPHRAPFGQECESCHAKPTSWRVPNFDHTRTTFQLEGVHADATCRSCHKGHATRRLAHETCEDCHTDVHTGQFAPDPCDSCHTVQIPAFAMVDFDHTRTDFPLLGAHSDKTCTDCHGEGIEARYRPLEHEDCSSCHEDDHEGRFDPTPCKVCHVETSWEVGDFDHERTDFPLTGEHASVACEGCHGEGLYAGLPFGSCVDCHEEMPHDQGIEATCDSCHVTTSFETITFDHTSTGFELHERHSDVSCVQCHEDTSDFEGRSTTCDSCHKADRPSGHYTGTCEGCHQGADWLPASLGELGHAVTGFPLKGQHKAASCEDCHPAGQARGSTPDTCAACHAIDDPHRNMLGNQCSDCHSEVSWLKTRFRHVQTGWPLRGLHRVAECSDCHAVSYVGTPTSCWRCHEAEAPTDIESHQSPFFVTCDECHNPYSWSAVRFAH